MTTEKIKEKMSKIADKIAANHPQRDLLVDKYTSMANQLEIVSNGTD